MKKMISVAFAGALALSTTACYTPQDRAVGGAALGGLTGAAIGAAASGGRAGATLAGAALGAAGGAIVGAATTPPPPGQCPAGYYRAVDGYFYCR